MKVERAQHLQGKVDGVHHFGLDLIRAAEDVGIIDGEAAHARQATEFAGLLIAIDLPELGQPHRQVAVRPQLAVIDLNMVRTVHGFEQVPVFFAVLLAFGIQRHGGELAVAVIRIVAAGLIEFEPSDVGRDHGQVAAIELFLLEEVRERLAHGCAFGQPQGQARPYLIAEGEQLQLAPELTVVALPCQFEAFEVFVELRPVAPGGAIDAGELRLAGIASPVGPGHRHELDRVGLDIAGMGHMRPPAQVYKRVLLIDGDSGLLVVGQGGAILIDATRRKPVDQFDLIGVVPKQFAGLVCRHFAHLKGMAPLEDLLHARLDPRDVLLIRRVRQVEVIVKTIFNRRADRRLGVGETFDDRLRQHVRGGVPDLVQLRVVALRNVLFGVSLQVCNFHNATRYS